MAADRQLQADRSGYDPGPGFDEAFAAPGEPREHYAALLEALRAVDLSGLHAAVSAHVEAQGSTFGAGADAEPFRVDPVPRLVTAAEWEWLETGLGQRVRALDAFVADLAGDQEAVAAGVVPERLAAGLPRRERDLEDAPPAPGARVAIAGLDVVRDAEGAFRVLEDNVRTPSGIAYVIAARQALDAHLPIDGPRRAVRAAAAEQLVRVLAAARPDPGGDGATVVLSDGPENSAWFEHRALAELAGIPVVGRAGLRLDGDRLRLRDDGAPVSVLYRRTDADRLRDDDERLTELGELLLSPLRAGTLAVVNAFGSGAADDKRIYPYVEALIGFYLGEEPEARSVATYDLEDRERRAEALERLDELVVKPRGGYGGRGVTIGPHADDEALRQARAAIEAEPGAWIAQETVRLSTHPTVVDGALAPRHVDLRPFVFYDGEQTALLPGGLTRVALQQGSMLVNSTAGGGGKDTWVLP